MHDFLTLKEVLVIHEVVIREFGTQCHVGYRVERHRRAGHSGEAQQPQEQAGLGQLRRREEQGEKCKCERYGGKVHEGMAAAISRASGVRPRANDGIAEGVDTQRDEDCGTCQGRGQPEYLIVVEEQKEPERRGLHSFRHLTNGVYEA